MAPHEGRALPSPTSISRVTLSSRSLASSPSFFLPLSTLHNPSPSLSLSPSLSQSPALSASLSPSPSDEATDAKRVGGLCPSDATIASIPNAAAAHAAT
eukprot:727207-Pleurochrysis_carterae.AAC.1